jgi:hypothetical protein
LHLGGGLGHLVRVFGGGGGGRGVRLRCSLLLTGGIQIWINVPGRRSRRVGAAPSITIEMLAFVGAVCVEIAVAFAFCVVRPLWLTDCDWPPEEPCPPASDLCRLVHGVVVRGLRRGL